MDTGNIMEDQLQQMYDHYEFIEKQKLEEARKFAIRFNADYYKKHKSYPKQHIVASAYASYRIEQLLDVEEEIQRCFKLSS